jgi:hypothetical protein
MADAGRSLPDFLAALCDTKDSFVGAGKFVRSFFRDMFCGMQRLVNAGISHNDLHTWNIMVDHEGLARFIDFGAATITTPAEAAHRNYDVLWLAFVFVIDTVTAAAAAAAAATTISETNLEALHESVKLVLNILQAAPKASKAGPRASSTLLDVDWLSCWEGFWDSLVASPCTDDRQLQKSRLSKLLQSLPPRKLDVAVPPPTPVSDHPYDEREQALHDLLPKFGREGRLFPDGCCLPPVVCVALQDAWEACIKQANKSGRHPNLLDDDLLLATEALYRPQGDEFLFIVACVLPLRGCLASHGGGADPGPIIDWLSRIQDLLPVVIRRGAGEVVREAVVRNLLHGPFLAVATFVLSKVVVVP